MFAEADRGVVVQEARRVMEGTIVGYQFPLRATLLVWIAFSIAGAGAAEDEEAKSSLCYCNDICILACDASPVSERTFFCNSYLSAYRSFSLESAFEAALGPEYLSVFRQLYPATADFNGDSWYTTGPDGIEWELGHNGIPDCQFELGLIEEVLWNDCWYDLPNGLTRQMVSCALERNGSQFARDVGWWWTSGSLAEKMAGLPEIMIGLMTLGDGRFDHSHTPYLAASGSAGIVALGIWLAGEIVAQPEIDLENYTRLHEYLAKDGDADGDGCSNWAEYVGSAGNPFTYRRRAALCPDVRVGDCVKVWYVDKNSHFPEQGLTWQTAFRTIQEAIDAAHNGGGGEVHVAEGVFDERRNNPEGSLVLWAGVKVYGGFVVGQDRPYQRNLLQHVTVIDGSKARGGQPAYHVVTGDDNALLDGFRITGGDASQAGGFRDGGGMLNITYSPKIVNCVFVGNVADNGGAMFNDSGASPNVDNCYFVGNTALSKGGAVCNSGGARPRFMRCFFTENSAVVGGGYAVYLDLRDAFAREGRGSLDDKYGNLFEIYERIIDEDPHKTPMRIYPAVHYTMGGLWVDYNLMSNLPGLYVIGEANFSDHGANRLGASALMQGLADGYFILPYTIGDFLAGAGPSKVSPDHPAARDAQREVQARIDRLIGMRGKRTVDEVHRELGMLLWDKCGMSRNAQGLQEALERIPELRDEFLHNVNVVGSQASFNQTLERAGRVSDFLELAELMCLDALSRNESCGCHFREEYQTSDGEALRNDEDYCHVAAWQYKGPGAPPVPHKEPLAFEEVKPSTRSYK